MQSLYICIPSHWLEVLWSPSPYCVPNLFQATLPMMAGLQLVCIFIPSIFSCQPEHTHLSHSLAVAQTSRNASSSCLPKKLNYRVRKGLKARRRDTADTGFRHILDFIVPLRSLIERLTWLPRGLLPHMDLHVYPIMEVAIIRRYVWPLRVS